MESKQKEFLLTFSAKYFVVVTLDLFLFNWVKYAIVLLKLSFGDIIL